MKRYLKECIHLCVVFCVLFGIGLSVFIYDSRPHETQYIHSYSKESYVKKGFEGNEIITNTSVLAVVKITGSPIETKVKREYSTDYFTHVKAEVIEVIHGTKLENGEQIYLRQLGNSEAVYVNALKAWNISAEKKKISRVEESGGYLQKGEMILVLLLPNRDSEMKHCGRVGKHICCSVFDYAIRTVNKDGSLGYRTDSVYGKYKNLPGAFPFELPYSQFNTLQEVRDAVPKWIERLFEYALNRELTQEERKMLAANKYTDALNVLYGSRYGNVYKNIRNYMSSLKAKN